MAPCIERGMKVVALPMAEECSNAPSDTGSDPEMLKEEFPKTVDFDHVFHGWHTHEGDFAVDPAALIRRATKLRRWIKSRPEKEVVLVAHGFFNHYLTGDVNEKGEQTTPWWKEAELRTYTFEQDATSRKRPFEGGPEDVDGEDSAMIQETEDSLLRLRQRDEAVTGNTNRPADREHGLIAYQSDALPNA